MGRSFTFFRVLLSPLFIIIISLLSAIKRNLISSKLSFLLFPKYYFCNMPRSIESAIFFSLSLSLFYETFPFPDKTKLKITFSFYLSFHVSRPKNFCYYSQKSDADIGFMAHALLSNLLAIRTRNVIRQSCVFIYALQSFQTVRGSLKNQEEKRYSTDANPLSSLSS